MNKLYFETSLNSQWEHRKTNFFPTNSMNGTSPICNILTLKGRVSSQSCPSYLHWSEIAFTRYKQVNIFRAPILTYSLLCPRSIMFSFSSWRYKGARTSCPKSVVRRGKREWTISVCRCCKGIYEISTVWVWYNSLRLAKCVDVVNRVDLIFWEEIELIQTIIPSSAIFLIGKHIADRSVVLVGTANHLLWRETLFWLIVLRISIVWRISTENLDPNTFA